MSGAIGSANLHPQAIFDATKKAAVSGNVTTRRFVSLSSDTEVARAGLQSKSYGISPDTVDDGVTTSILVSGPGEVELGNTVTAGQLLMPDANGKAIPYASGGAGTTVYPGAYALAGGVVGDFVPCFVIGQAGAIASIVTGS